MSVYFIQSGVSGPIKIGVAANPVQRLSDLQCGNPVMLRLLASVPGAHALETKIHRSFRRDWIHREWFSPSAELLAFIAAIANRGAVDLALEERVALAAARRANMTAAGRSALVEAMDTFASKHGVSGVMAVTGCSAGTARNARTGRCTLSGPSIAAMLAADPACFGNVFQGSRRLVLVNALREIMDFSTSPAEAAKIVGKLRAARRSLDALISLADSAPLVAAA